MEYLRRWETRTMIHFRRRLGVNYARARQTPAGIGRSRIHDTTTTTYCRQLVRTMRSISALLVVRHCSGSVFRKARGSGEARLLEGVGLCRCICSSSARCLASMLFAVRCPLPPKFDAAPLLQCRILGRYGHDGEVRAWGD